MIIDKLIGRQPVFSLAHRSLNTVLLCAIILAFIATAYNWLIGYCYVDTAISLSCGITVCLLYYLSLVKKKYVIPIIVFSLAVFLVITFLWLQYGGISGGAPFYIMMFSSIIAVLLRGVPRFVAIGCLFTITGTLMLLEYFHPEMIGAAAPRFERYSAMSFNLLITLLANVVIFFLILHQYNKEHERANQYLATIEKQKNDILSQQFIHVYNASPALMAIYRERDLVYISANDAWLKCLGFKCEEVIGRSEEELNTLVLPEMRASLSNLARGMTEECKVKTKLGEIREWLVSGAQIHFGGEQCVLLTAVDRTMSNYLNKGIARLDRLNLVGEMAASIGHEIRNPLTTVRGFLQFLGKKEQYTADRESFSLMIMELDRANSIITEFLSLAKNRNIQLKLYDLNNIIEGLYSLIYANSVSMGIEVFLELGAIPNILMDENEIRQLLLNLVRNAVEAVPGGGQIVISTCLVGGQVLLAVKDTGKGIPPEIFEKLGTPFLTTKDKGTGLGLAVCYRIVERHNAKLEIATGEKGTTISIEFKVL